MTDLGTLGGSFSRAFGLNNQGQILGESDTASRRASRHSLAGRQGDRSGSAEQSAAAELGLQHQRTRPDRWNRRPPVCPAGHLWDSGTMVDLGTLGGTYGYAVGINNRGDVVGISGDPANNFTHALLWRAGATWIFGVLDGLFSYANSINERGQIAGSSDISPGQHHAVLWQAGVPLVLGTLGGTFSTRRHQQPGTGCGIERDGAGRRARILLARR